MFEPSRPPTTESWSTSSSTVAVRAVGADHAADEAVVVEHGHVGGGRRSVVPASMVTVRENDCAGPIATTRAGTSA